MSIEAATNNLKRINDNYINSNILRKVNNKIWKYPEFSQWPASIGNHHGYEGGLVIHTDEVLRYAMNTSAEFEVDLDVLYTAILWHDLAKIWDYKLIQYKDAGNFFEKSDYHSNIHHITGSIAEFTRHALNGRLDRCTLEKIQHCMAGHHGYPEYRSPVTPKSVEAIILHYSDMLSATHGKTK